MMHKKREDFLHTFRKLTSLMQLHFLRNVLSKLLLLMFDVVPYIAGGAFKGINRSQVKEGIVTKKFQIKKFLFLAVRLFLMPQTLQIPFN